MSAVYKNGVKYAGIANKLEKDVTGALFTNGINPKDSTSFQVKNVSGEMKVVVSPGLAVIEGIIEKSEKYNTLTISDSSVSNPRIDTIVLRLTINDNKNTCELAVVKGTEAASPVHPNLTRTSTVYELGLADVLVAKSVITIESSAITDTRYDTSRCGVISCLTTIDTSALNDLMAKYQKENQASFEAWVDTIKDILDDSVAGNLQNEIEALQTKIDNLKLLATNVTYDDSSTSLGATNVQGAVEALNTH